MNKIYLKMNKQVLYSYLLSLLQARLTKLVTYKHVKQALKRNRIHDTLSDIEGTILGEYLVQCITPESKLNEAEECLWKYLKDEIDMLYSIKLKDLHLITTSYITKYDVKNIIQVIRSLITNTKVQQLVPIGALAKNGMLELLRSIENVDNMVDVLRKAGLTIFANIISDNRYIIESKDYKSLGVLEAKLTKEYLRQFYRNVKKIKRGGSALRRAVLIISDVYNIIHVLRSVALDIDRNVAEEVLVENTYKVSLALLKDALSQETIDRVIQILSLAPYHELAEKIGNALSMGMPEALIDVLTMDWMIKEVHLNLLSHPLSVQIVLDYLLSKEKEIALMRLVYWCIWNNIPRDIVERLLSILGD